MYRYSPERLSDVVQMLTAVMPDVVSAGQAPTLRKRLAELEMVRDVRQGPFGRYQNLVQADTNSETLIEAAKTAPLEIKNNLIQSAMWKALGEGNEDRARQIAEEIVDPHQRAEAILNLDRQTFNNAVDAHKTAIARNLLSRFPSEERAQLLLQLAGDATSRGDKPAALTLVREAEALVGNMALNYAQLEAHLQIAQAYGQLDPNKQGAIFERVTDRINELAAAASVLSGFELDNYFRRGEFIINGGSRLASFVTETAGGLGSIASRDFDLARKLAERFQLREVRVVALLQIAQHTLSGDSGQTVEPGSTS
jgi:hypothetical protein